MTGLVAALRGATYPGMTNLRRAADRIEELETQNAEMRERLRFHDTFLSTLREACLTAQGIQKDEPLGVRAVADRGLRIIFSKE